MILIQSILERNFTVKDGGKFYHINYLNSDGQILGLLNRSNWEVTDEEGEGISVYEFQCSTKKEKEQIRNNIKLLNKLIKFCIKHFDNYQPNYEEDF